MSAADEPAVALQSTQQLSEQLWADTRLSLYGVAMGTRLAGLPARLAEATAANELDDYDCLRPGALTPAEQEAAPWLLRLRRDTPFTHWLLFQAAADLGPWGVVVASPRPMTPVRNHLRNHLRAQGPDGRAFDLAWMDPELLQALLPLFSPAGLAGFLGPVEQLVLPAAGQWQRVSAPLGRLTQASVRWLAEA